MADIWAALLAAIVPTGRAGQHRGLLRLVAVASAFGMAAAVLPLSPSPVQAAAIFERASGSDRYGTAAAISRQAFNPGVSAAYIATGFDFPDALAAAPAAAAAKGPLLLVTPKEVPPATATELSRLQPGKIVVVGNQAAVSEQVVIALRSHTRGPVERLSGSDLFGTAAAVATASFQPGVSAVFIANGRNFPDGLGGGAAAGALGGPVLFVEPDALPTVTSQALNALRPTSIIVLGGMAAVSSAVEAQLARYSSSVKRYAGPSRFTTSAAVASAVFPGPVSTVYLATGGAFPDALAGGPAAAAAGGPLLLTQRDCIPTSVDVQLDRLDPDKVIVLGGSTAIGEGVLSRTPCKEPATLLHWDMKETAADCLDTFYYRFEAGRIAGEPFPHTIWCPVEQNFDVFLEYDLSRRYGAFEVTVGQLDNSGSTTDRVEFRVLVDGLLVASREVDFGKKQVLRVGVPNALRLRLELVRLTPNHGYWADRESPFAAWGEPRLTP